jgi:hypothetical protein
MREMKRETSKELLFFSKSIKYITSYWYFYTLLKEIRINVQLIYQNIRLIKKMSRQFKMSNKHVCIFYVSKTHLHFTIVRSYQRSKVNESNITEVE